MENWVSDVGVLLCVMLFVWWLGVFSDESVVGHYRSLASVFYRYSSL